MKKKSPLRTNAVETIDATKERNERNEAVTPRLLTRADESTPYPLFQDKYNY